MTTRSVSLLIGVALVCLLLFAAFVWPTPYYYWTANGHLFRASRFGGTGQARTDWGWEDLPRF